jgi:hypothetical protein
MSEKQLESYEAPTVEEIDTDGRPIAITPDPTSSR